MQKTKLELIKELIAELTENKKAYEAKERDIIAKYKKLIKDAKEQNE